MTESSGQPPKEPERGTLLAKAAAMALSRGWSLRVTDNGEFASLVGVGVNAEVLVDDLVNNLDSVFRMLDAQADLRMSRFPGANRHEFTIDGQHISERSG